MRRWAVVLSAFTISLGAATAVTGATANAGNDNDPYTLSNGHAQGGPAGGFVPAQADQASNTSHPGGGGSASRNLIYHNGPVQHATVVEPIFVGPDWNTNAAFTADKVTGLESLYTGFATTNSYGNTNFEYTDFTTQHVNPVLTYDGKAVFDTTTNITVDPGTTALGNEVVKALGGTPVAGGYYPVYIEGKRGSAGYCAYHDTTTYTDKQGNVTEFQVGFFFNLDGDSGCNPNSPASLGHSQGLAALANVTGHEYSEMVTDPQLNAWWDQQGNENSDKCAWTFGSNPVTFTTQGVTTQWKIQGNWSNAANLSGRGYISGRSRVVGCIDGTNA